MKGKIALVTGGSRGIGRAIALKLAEAGCDVAVFYAGRKDAAEETVQQLQGLGVRAICVQCDVSDENQVAAAFKQVCDELEITLYGSGIDDQSLTYHLNAAEKEVLREKMEAYCMQREHKPLNQLCQEILQEQDAPTQEMQL